MNANHHHMTHTFHLKLSLDDIDDLVKEAYADVYNSGTGNVSLKVLTAQKVADVYIGEDENGASEITISVDYSI